MSIDIGRLKEAAAQAEEAAVEPVGQGRLGHSIKVVLGMLKEALKEGLALPSENVNRLTADVAELRESTASLLSAARLKSSSASSWVVWKVAVRAHISTVSVSPRRDNLSLARRGTGSSRFVHRHHPSGQNGLRGQREFPVAGGNWPCRLMWRRPCPA